MNSRGQYLLEFAMVTSLVVAVLIAMNFFAKRAVQGRLRSYSDEVSQGNAFYAPRKTSGQSLMRRRVEESSNSFEEEIDGQDVQVSESTVTINQNTTRSEDVAP